MSSLLDVTRRFAFLRKRRLHRLTGSLDRDDSFALGDRLELRLISRLLDRGGDFVDVGAHVGLHTVSAARHLRGRGRVLAFEPNLSARVRLEENVAHNGCSNVVVEPVAVAEEEGFATLETTTLDAEVERLALRPAVVKIDVEGSEVDVVRGARRLLRRRPALLIKLVDENAARMIAALTRLGYSVARAGTRHLEPWSAEGGASNAVFLQPWQLALLRPHEQRVFANPEEHVEEPRAGSRRAAEQADWAQALARDTDGLETRPPGELEQRRARPVR